MKPNKKQKREFELLNELQENHGYTLREVPKGQRVLMMFSLHGEKKTIEAARVCQLVVPKDSALAIGLDEAAAKEPKHKKAVTKAK